MKKQARNPARMNRIAGLLPGIILRHSGHQEKNIWKSVMAANRLWARANALPQPYSPNTPIILSSSISAGLENT